jgi:hypothetical protein
MNDQQKKKQLVISCLKSLLASIEDDEIRIWHFTFSQDEPESGNSLFDIKIALTVTGFIRHLHNFLKSKVSNS